MNTRGRLISRSFGIWCPGAWCGFTLMLLLFAVQGRGQQLPAVGGVGGNMQTPIAGAGHEYIQMLSESVNPATGGLTIRINLPVPKGRGITAPVVAAYNSGELDSLIEPNGAPLWATSTQNPNGQATGWGTPASLPLEGGSSIWNFTSPEPPGVPPAVNCNLISGFSLTDLNGVAHTLYSGGQQLAGGALQQSSCSNDIVNLSGGDGQFTGFIPATNSAGTSTTSLLAGGSSVPMTAIDIYGNTYSFVSGSVGQIQSPSGATMEDRNGNLLTTTDTAGRPLPYLQLPDVSGTHQYTVYGLTYTITTTTTTVNYTPTESSLLIENGADNCNVTSTFGANSATLTVISSITLPDGQKYQFQYDPTYGTVNKIIYPGGGWVEYEWGMSPDPQAASSFPATQSGTGSQMPDACTFEFTTPVVTSRTVSFDGTDDAQSQSFTYGTEWNDSDDWTSKSTQVTTTDEITGNSFLTSYAYSPTWNGGTPPYGTAQFYNVSPMEQTVQHYDWGNSSTPLETVTKSWISQFQEACEVHTLNNGQSYGHFYTWNYGFISDDKEYDFSSSQQGNLVADCSPASPTTPSGTPTRETVTTFQQFTSPASSNLTFAKPSQVTVYSNGTEIAQTLYSYDGSTVQPVSTLTNHDETHFGSGQQTGRGNLTEVTKVCVSGTGCSGNRVTTYTYDESGQMLTQTDACGNGSCAEMSGTGHTTTFSYTDNYSSGAPPGTTNAYVTGITFPTPPDGVPLTESFAYSWTPGELTSSIDENKQTTSYTYDSIYRLIETKFPDGGINYMGYNDAPPNPSVTTCKLLNTGTSGMACPISGAPSGSWTSSTDIMDGVGHTIHSELTTDPDAPNNIDYVDTTYDGEGRVRTKSNPHWSSTQPSDGTTTLYYDALGRTVAQQQPDASVVQTCYNDVPSVMPSGISAKCNGHLGSVTTGSWVDSTDELGNEWQRTMDSFGNLTEAMEPNGTSQSPSMETDYTYNGFNDLLGVVQKGDGTGNRTRSFAYDSFAELIGANNPETAGSVNSPTLGQTSPASLTCPGISGTWTTCYAYDLNGNVSKKTDNRGIFTYYTYDNLNRTTARSFSDGQTPANSFGYDGYTANGTLLSWSLYSVGRMSQSSNGINAATEYSHDPMGRVALKEERIPGGTTYSAQISANYDLAGDLTSMTNGSTAQPITFGYTYDSAARLQTLTSNWTTGSDHPATIFQANSASQGNPSYGPAGLLYAELGIPSGSQNPFVTQNRLYDDRQRITNEAYNATAVSNSAATHSNGVITITPPTGADSSSALPGTGMVTITGTDQSTQINPCEPHSSCPQTIWDSGTVSVTINGTQYTTGYGEYDTGSSLASNLASVVNNQSSLVNAAANGDVLTITAKTTGPSTNYTLSASSATSDPQYFSGPSFTGTASGSTLTGGSNGDTGTVTATINGCSGNYSWGPSDTASSVASGLKASIASHCSSTLSTSVTGTTVSLTSVATGSATNWPVSVTVTNTDPSYPFAFFSAGESGMSGGVDDGIDADLAYSYTIPSGGYDAANNVRTVIDSVMGTWNYTYDSLNRLSTGTNSSGPYVTQNSGALVYGCWTYDGFGNRKTEAAPTTTACNNSPTSTYQATYNASNQVTESGLMPSGYTYDSAGDVTDDGANQYLYDGAGRICAVWNLNSNVMMQYIYDGEGNRVAKGTITTFNCNRSGNGFALSTQYVIGLGGEQLSELTSTNGWTNTSVFAGGGLLATYTGVDTVFNLTDWQGTKRGETSAAGCVSSWSSLAYGNNLTQSGNCTDASEHHYMGKVRDSETGYASGNDDFGARYFASSEGRWLSPDWAAAAEAVPYASYASPQSLNLYAFVGNNPTSRTDPDGHSPYGAQLECAGGPEVGPCGVGTDPDASGIYNSDPHTGCEEGEAACASNPYMSLAQQDVAAAAAAADAAADPSPDPRDAGPAADSSPSQSQKGTNTDDPPGFSGIDSHGHPIPSCPCEGEKKQSDQKQQKPEKATEAAERFKQPKSGISGKEGAKDAPEWAKGSRPKVGESGKAFAKRLMDNKYGPGKWNDRVGPGKEFNQIRKWGDRAFQDPPEN